MNESNLFKKSEIGQKEINVDYIKDLEKGLKETSQEITSLNQELVVKDSFIKKIINFFWKDEKKNPEKAKRIILGLLY